MTQRNAAAPLTRAQHNEFRRLTLIGDWFTSGEMRAVLAALELATRNMTKQSRRLALARGQRYWGRRSGLFSGDGARKEWQLPAVVPWPKGSLGANQEAGRRGD
jgi:hypothetical protein